ncbi:MAG: aryl-sulfate sulfotransferase [Bacteroidota bacterium]
MQDYTPLPKRFRVSTLRYGLIPLLIVAVFTGCDKDDDEVIPIPTEPMPCSELETFRDQTTTLSNNGVLVKSVDAVDETFLLEFENGNTWSLDASCVNGWTLDSLAWSMEVNYEDAQNQTLGFIGNISADYVLNPSGFAPLSAEVSVSAPVPGRVQIRVVGQKGIESDLVHTFTTNAESQTVPVHGLYADYANQVELSWLNPNGNVRTTTRITITTQALNDDLPNITVQNRDFASMQEGWTLVSSLAIFNPNVPYIFDAFGDIRWYLDYNESTLLDNLYYDVGIERLANGNFYFGDLATAQIYEIDLFGRILNQWEMPGYGFHHHVQEKPDGNFLVTVNKYGSTHLNGSFTVEDHIIEIDRITGAIVMEWDLRELLDEYRTSLIDLLDEQYIDWVHCNAVLYDPNDQTIIVSGRTQGVFKLNYEHELVWILAPHEGWGQNRLGQNLDNFLLEAVDPLGNPYSPNVQEGGQNAADFEWNWYQHATKLMPNGNVILFDNGQFRNFDFSDFSGYSRAVEYRIDEDNLEVEQIWTYGKEEGPQLFSEIISDVDYDIETNNVIISAGFGVRNAQNEVGARVLEIDYSTQTISFDAFIESYGLAMHRSQRLTMYPE